MRLGCRGGGIRGVRARSGNQRRIYEGLRGVLSNVRNAIFGSRPIAVENRGAAATHQGAAESHVVVARTGPTKTVKGWC